MRKGYSTQFVHTGDFQVFATVKAKTGSDWNEVIGQLGHIDHVTLASAVLQRLGNPL